jgi:hypothetical protein
MNVMDLEGSGRDVIEVLSVHLLGDSNNCLTHSALRLRTVLLFA